MSERPDKSASEAADPAQAQPPVEANEELSQLREALAAKEARVDELARALSAQVEDQKQYRVRLEREKDRVLESERGKIALHLLKVGDEIERALAAATADTGPLAKGVRLIHEGLGKTLAQLGLERLSLVGASYDPNLAEVVDVVPVQDQQSDGKVVSEISPGFKMGEKVVRAARVTVGRWLPAQSDGKAKRGPEEGAGA